MNVVFREGLKCLKVLWYVWILIDFTMWPPFTLAFTARLLSFSALVSLLILLLLLAIFLGALCPIALLPSPLRLPAVLGAMRFPDSGKFPDLFHSPKIEILRIGNLGKESGEGVGGSCQITLPYSQILKILILRE
jgi:hypothetical protein